MSLYARDPTELNGRIRTLFDPKFSLPPDRVSGPYGNLSDQSQIILVQGKQHSRPGVASMQPSKSCAIILGVMANTCSAPGLHDCLPFVYFKNGHDLFEEYTDRIGMIQGDCRLKIKNSYLARPIRFYIHKQVSCL